VTPWQFEATVAALLSIRFTIKTSLCALKDVPRFSFFSEGLLCKGHFWRQFSQIVPFPSIPFKHSLIKTGKLVKSCRNRNCVAQDALEGAMISPIYQQL
jgi:hypothetical protein